MEQVEKNILLNTDQDHCTIFYQGLREALQSLTTPNNINTTATTTNSTTTPTTTTSMTSVSNLANMTTKQILETIQTYQTKIRETVPIPRSKEDEKAASLVYLNKIRVASQICLLYVLIPPQDMETKLKLAGTLSAANDAIFESIKLLKETLKEPNGNINANRENGKKDDGSKTATTDTKNGNYVKLEDAWNKVLEYDLPKEEESVNPDVITIDDGDSSTPNEEPNAKRQKTTNASNKTSIQTKRLSIRTKILLVGGRKPPSNLVDALRRKRAVLCHHPTKGSTFSSMTFLKLQFGQAFEMVIYVSPLLVRIKAITDGDKVKRERRRKQQYGSSKNGMMRQYHIMGVSGGIDMVGPLIAKKLEYSSAHATRCLRRCFADLACRANSSDFETEILEGNALLKFLSLARNTYCPNWIDAELD